MRARIGTAVVVAVAAAALGILLHWIATRFLTGPITVLGDEFQLLAPRYVVAWSVLPILIWITTRSLADLPKAQRWLGLFLRGGLMAVLSVALARPSKTAESSQVSCMFLVDVSDSVTDEALAASQERVDAAWRERGDNDLQVIAFGADARLVPIPEGADEVPRIERDLEPSAGRATDPSRGTNMAAALQLAYGLFPPGHLRRAVFLSDGDQTKGDVLAEASRAAGFGVPVSFVPDTGGAPREVAIGDLELPDRIKVGEPFHVRLKVFASVATTARVRLYQGQTINGLDGVRDVELPAGNHELRFDSIVRVAGPITYRAEIEPTSADRFAENNRFETSAIVPGRPSVLYVEGARGRGQYLAQALTAGEFEVDVRSPRAIPTSLRELERFDFFILSDVPAEEVSLSQQDAIERYVRHLGGGFLMAGGESAFGLGGWQGSRIERILPVRMESQRRRDQPSLALALVIDKSGSMNGQKIELAKEAAKSTAELLGGDDYIEVIGFDSAPQPVVRMQSARNRVRILRDIGRLQARGGTNIFPALDLAYQDLAVTRARIKHVILLTDGQSPEQGIPELAQVMRAEGITVSTVGLGADVNRGFLQNLANLGGGRAYLTNDPHNVPRIFMRETTTVARSSAVEDYFSPVVVERADFLRGIDLRTAPYLRGYVATQAKRSPAQVILQSDLGEPVLARQHHGLGWTLAWTSDVKNRWAVDWLRWRGFSPFWSQLVREHMRKRRRENLPMQAEIVGGRAHVVVDAMDESDQFLNGLDSTLTVRGPMGTRSRPGDGTGPADQEAALELPMRQTAPGRYETSFPLNRYGSFVLSAQHAKDGQTIAESTTQIANPYPREYAPTGSGEALLGQIAEITGGTRNPAAEDLFDPGDDRITHYEELWPKLVYLALALFVLDLLLRRVRLPDRR